MMNIATRELLKSDISTLFEKYGRDNVDDFVLIVIDYISLETGYIFDFW